MANKVTFSGPIQSGPVDDEDRVGSVVSVMKAGSYSGSGTGALTTTAATVGQRVQPNSRVLLAQVYQNAVGTSNSFLQLGTGPSTPAFYTYSYIPLSNSAANVVRQSYYGSDMNTIWTNENSVSLPVYRSIETSSTGWTATAFLIMTVGTEP